MCKLNKLIVVTSLITAMYSMSVLADEKNTVETTPKKVNTNKQPATQMTLSKPTLPFSATQANYANKLNDINKYQALIDELELQQGVYGADMSQHLVSLGLAYQNNRKFEQSIEPLKRAIHLTKINEGLYTANQLTIIKHLIKSYKSLQKWDEVNDKYQYYFWLSLRNYGENDPKLLPALLTLANWHLQAFSLKLDSAPGQHLLVANSLFTHARDMIVNSYSDTDTRLIEPLQGIMVCSYFFATFQSAVEEANISDKFDNLALESSVNYTTLKRRIGTSYRSGKEAHEHMVRVAKNSNQISSLVTAKAMVNLADWYLLFDKPNSAFDVYQQAQQYLASHNIEQNQINQLFGKPVLLPELALLDNRIVNESELEKLDANKEHVVVSFDVTHTGRARNVEIVSSNPQDNSYIRSRVLRSLRNATVRPKMIAGMPTPSENNRLGFLID